MMMPFLLDISFVSFPFPFSVDVCRGSGGLVVVVLVCASVSACGRENSPAQNFLYSAPPRLPVCSRACLLPCLRCALVFLLLSSIFVSACCDGYYVCVLSSCRLCGFGEPVQRIVVRRSKTHESVCIYVHLSAAFAMWCLMAYVVRF